VSSQTGGSGKVDSGESTRLAHIVGVFARRKAPSLVEGKPAAAANTLVPSTIGLDPTESRHERRPLKSLGFGLLSTGADLSRSMSPGGLLDDQLHGSSAHGRQRRRQRSPQRHHGHAIAAQGLLFEFGQFLDERFQSLQSQSCDIAFDGKLLGQVLRISTDTVSGSRHRTHVMPTGVVIH